MTAAEAQAAADVIREVGEAAMAFVVTANGELSRATGRAMPLNSSYVQRREKLARLIDSLDASLAVLLAALDTAERERDERMTKESAKALVDDAQRWLSAYTKARNELVAAEGERDTLRIELDEMTEARRNGARHFLAQVDWRKRVEGERDTLRAALEEIADGRAMLVAQRIAIRALAAVPGRNETT